MSDIIYHHWVTLMDGTVIEYESPGIPPGLYGSMPLHLPAKDGLIRTIAPHAIRDIASTLVKPKGV